MTTGATGFDFDFGLGGGGGEQLETATTNRSAVAATRFDRFWSPNMRRDDFMATYYSAAGCLASIFSLHSPGAAC
jgi:hypothetical protein